MEAIKRFVNGDEGQDMVEYALIGALVSIVAIAVIMTMGAPINAIWGAMQGALAGGA